MTTPSTSPRRLVYGPAEYAGYPGIVLDAESAIRLGHLAQVKTLSEAVPLIYSVTWSDYVAEVVSDGEAPPAADDVFDFETRLSEGEIVTPQEDAWDVASSIVEQLVAADPSSFNEVIIGGGSPGGNIDFIAGPLDQLELLASRINSADFGIVLERDDALVDVGMARHLYS